MASMVGFTRFKLLTMMIALMRVENNKLTILQLVFKNRFLFKARERH